MGLDPNLAKEYVILAAHYDHLGRTKQGLCLGACDNASGVAALLEIAEELALAPQRPRRSVCFAAFDQEEKFSLGALALTCRQDYDPNRIAGVVNLDMLGRHPLLWGVPKFEWIGAVLPDRFISLEDQGTGQYSLNAATLCIGVKHIQPPIWIWPVQPMKTSAGFWIDWIGFEGTKEDLIDTYLLRWGAIKKVDFLAESLQKILCRVTDTDQGRTYQE